jgi:hypothetical protein
MITDPQYTQFRLASSLFSIVRYLWYSPAIQIAVVRMLS